MRLSPKDLLCPTITCSPSHVPTEGEDMLGENHGIGTGNA